MTHRRVDSAPSLHYKTRLTNESIHYRHETTARGHLLDAGSFCRLGQGPERWTEILISAKIFPQQTHRRPKAVGFLFPVIGSGKPTPSHMKPNDNDEPPEEYDERNPIAILSSIYLEAGLPLEAAAKSAIADYESIFDEPALCAT